MKYLCLIYGREADDAQLGTPERDALMAEYGAFMSRFGAHIQGGEELAPTASASTVRVRGGKMSVTDGPFAETREQLGGYFLIEAADLNQALQVAAGIPTASTGCVEVRPIVEHLGM
jgi:hypothetical protein